MNTLKNTKVGTLAGTIALLIAMVPMFVYTVTFKSEEAKLQNGVLTSPQFVINAK